ncbi:MAG TPA: hypothetical protein VEP90_23960, partial [Methylomirabilota bacterium]|nr:hypothetical protein [Methylomirabilota bacterium]
GGRVQFRGDRMATVPIALATNSQKNQIIERVRTIISDPDSHEVPRLEDEIDKLVYALYGLSLEEVEVIEKAQQTNHDIKGTTD